MKNGPLLYLLLATTAIGGAIALPLMAQTPPAPTPQVPAPDAQTAQPVPNATGNTTPPPPAAQWPGTTTTPVITPGQPVPTQLDAVTTAATRTRRSLDNVAETGLGVRYGPGSLVWLRHQNLLPSDPEGS